MYIKPFRSELIRSDHLAPRQPTWSWKQIQIYPFGLGCSPVRGPQVSSILHTCDSIVTMRTSLPSAPLSPHAALCSPRRDGTRGYGNRNRCAGLPGFTLQTSPASPTLAGDDRRTHRRCSFRGRGWTLGRAHAHTRAPALGHVAPGQGWRSRKCPEALEGRGSPLRWRGGYRARWVGRLRAEGPQRVGKGPRTPARASLTVRALRGEVGCWVRAGAGRATPGAPRGPRLTLRASGPSGHGPRGSGASEAGRNSRLPPSGLPALRPGPSGFWRRRAPTKRMCWWPRVGPGAPGRRRPLPLPWDWPLRALFPSIGEIGRFSVDWFIFVGWWKRCFIKVLVLTGGWSRGARSWRRF